ncbi:hypothetical protein B0H14DRAFT_2592069 [Mycena olivaceomarginata]|nr:hypothetical protein B0H14DRAFT_2592069 [Mycena olivaceomarginata]
MTRLFLAPHAFAWMKRRYANEPNPNLKKKLRQNDQFALENAKRKFAAPSRRLMMVNLNEEVWVQEYSPGPGFIASSVHLGLVKKDDQMTKRNGKCGFSVGHCVIVVGEGGRRIVRSEFPVSKLYDTRYAAASLRHMEESGCKKGIGTGTGGDSNIGCFLVGSKKRPNTQKDDIGLRGKLVESGQNIIFPKTESLEVDPKQYIELVRTFSRPVNTIRTKCRQG